MVLKAAVVFIAGGLTGSGIVALTSSHDAAPPVTSTAVGTVQASTDLPGISVDLSQTQNQHGYIQARFAVQRPFAALHPVQR